MEFENWTNISYGLMFKIIRMNYEQSPLKYIAKYCRSWYLAFGQNCSYRFEVLFRATGGNYLNKLDFSTDYTIIICLIFPQFFIFYF